MRRRVAVLAGALWVIAVAACGLTPTNGAPGASVEQGPRTAAVLPTAQSSADDVLWGRVPYCNCLAGSATVNVADALKEAKLTVSLKELSPRDGWLYFAVTFDPATTPGDQVSNAMVAGGAELLEGPP